MQAWEDKAQSTAPKPAKSRSIISEVDRSYQKSTDHLWNAWLYRRTRYENRERKQTIKDNKAGRKGKEIENTNKRYLLLAEKNSIHKKSKKISTIREKKVSTMREKRKERNSDFSWLKE